MTPPPSASRSADSLRVVRDGDDIVTLTFDRPHVRNALDWPTMTAFAEAVAALETPPLPRAVILTGAGREAFCSGGDLSVLRDHPTADDGRRLATLVGDALLVLERLPVPVIAAVNGYALGGGSEIALACDLRVAGADARLGLVHLRLALTPGWGAGQRLLRLVGYGRALEMLLTARPYDAAELHALGIVNVVAPAGEALPAARALAGRIAAADPDTVRAAKRLLQAGLRQPYDEALAAERDAFPPRWAAEPHLAAMDRFLERDRPSAERSAQPADGRSGDQSEAS